MTRYTPTPREADGMRRGIITQLQRHNPATDVRVWILLDLSRAADRRLIASVYADMAREAMASPGARGRR